MEYFFPAGVFVGCSLFACNCPCLSGFNNGKLDSGQDIYVQGQRLSEEENKRSVSRLSCQRHRACFQYDFDVFVRGPYWNEYKSVKDGGKSSGDRDCVYLELPIKEVLDLSGIRI